jgi:hypothetical protein
MVTDNLVDTNTLSKRLMVSEAVLEKNRVRRMGIPFVRLSPRCVRYANQISHVGFSLVSPPGPRRNPPQPQSRPVHSSLHHLRPAVSRPSDDLTRL